MLFETIAKGVEMILAALGPKVEAETYQRALPAFRARQLAGLERAWRDAGQELVAEVVGAQQEPPAGSPKPMSGGRARRRLQNT